MKKGLTILLVVMMLFTSLGTVFAGGQQEAAAPAPAAEAAPVVEADPVEEAALAYFANKADDNNIIKETAFVEMVAAGEEPFILDIRKAADYEAGHIMGAFNAPWGATAIPAALSSLPTDEPVYVYCYSGQTAGQTVALLNVAGIEAKSVRYGFKLGISKVEGYEDIMETTPNFLQDLGTDVDPAIEAAVVDYFATLNADETTKSNIISAASAKEMLDASEGDITVVSIRQAKDFAEGHIDGAINIPWGKGMQEGFAQLPKDEQIFLYCYSGQTAGQTVAIMKLLGYDVASIKSGFGTGMSGGGWNNEGMPVAK